MNEEKIFLGNTPSAARSYLLKSLGQFRDKKFVIPCCGQFAIAFAGVQAGIMPEHIDASDVALFTTLVGYHITGQSIKALKVKVDGEPFKGSIPELLYLLKLYTARRQAKNYFQRVYVNDYVDRKEAHVEKLIQSLARFDALKGMKYSLADMNPVIDRTLEDPDAVIWVNPPGYKKGYERMYDTGGVISWNEPQYTEFIPNKGHDELRNKSIGKPAVLIWYRYNEITPEDEPFCVFAFQKGKDRWDHLLTNHPELFVKDGIGYAKAPKTFHRPILPADYEIRPESVLSFKSVTNEEGLYYRDLFIHKLGTTGGYVTLLMLVDGMVAGAVAFSLIEKIGANAFDAYSEETYGITAPSHRHPKINRLLMMLIKSDEFFRRELDTVSFRSLGITTTCLSPYPEIKINRGIYHIFRREKLKDGSYKIRYRGDRTPQTYKEVLDEWLKKYSSGKASNSGE